MAKWPNLFSWQRDWGHPRRLRETGVLAKVKVAVIGSAGQLGADVSRAFGDAGHDVIPLSHSGIEVTDPDSVQKTLWHHRPEFVVNCAAYVRVDEAEDDVEAAFRVNAFGALNVARVCADLGALCIYISTDYVFDGEKAEPYTEEDTPGPMSVYGASKLAGEYLVRQACPKWMIVHVASLFGRTGARGMGGNFIETIVAQARAGAHLKVVNDTRISPTYSRDAAAAIVGLANQATPGVVHVTSSGSCTWYELAQKAIELCRLETSIEPVSSDAYLRRTARPRKSALNNGRAAKVLGAPLPHWEDALHRYFQEKGHLG